MKRFSITLAVLNFSMSVFAALPATTDPTLINVPQLPGGFVIGGTINYLQPSDSHGDLDYATLNANSTSVVKNIDPSYNWGWSINAGYIFPNTGNDINASFFHLDTDDTNSFSFGGNNIIVILPISVFAFGGFLTTNGESEANYDINQIDVTAGQFIDVGCRLILHPNAGLRWADIERKLNGNFNFFDLSGNPDAIYNSNEKSDFDGIGPLAGLDASYYIGSGFGLVGHFDAALLAGNINTKSNGSLIAFTEENSGFTIAFQNNSNERMVPILDGKLGANYTYVFNNSANTDLTLEAGWQVSKYFNAVDRLPSNIVLHSTSSLALQGPYADLTLHI